MNNILIGIQRKYDIPYKSVNKKIFYFAVVSYFTNENSEYFECDSPARGSIIPIRSLGCI